MDKIEGESSVNPKRPVGRVMKEQFEHDFGENGDDYYDDSDNASRNFKGGFRGGCGNRNGRGVRGNGNVYDRYNGGWDNRNRVEEGIDKNLNSIKMKIPSFQGKVDPDVYLDWEQRVELIYEYHNFSKEKKVKLAVAEFTNYAIVW